MPTQIHALRNHLTSAVLTATAMLDGKLPADAGNLRGLVRTLEDIRAIVASVSKYDWDESTSQEQIVDVRALMDAVVDDLTFVASAGDLHLSVEETSAERTGCYHLRGRRDLMHAALEETARMLVSSLPAGSCITFDCASGDTIALTATAPGTTPRRYGLSLPGRRLCSHPFPRAENIARVT